ncbi:MAG: hypothetical protein F6K18_09710 [Okeania sp. SIO2C2]|uniref:hypothetical protein n=1 Tax=Okeania sp. SIO2C2 TaxID=2607787 RepID=UPI0013BC2FD4|nr:hypothetical protein [Okeania sp. SIO2C2]
MKDIDPENLVFIDETGVILGLTRTHAGSNKGTRVYEMKPFYRGQKVTVIGAISVKEVVGLMTINNSMARKHSKYLLNIFYCLIYGQEQ